MKASVLSLPRKDQKPTTKMKLTCEDDMMNKTKAQGGNFAALLGLDWGSVEHALCLYDCTTGQRDVSTLEHTTEAIAQWAAALQKRLPNGKIAICLEQAKAAVICALLAVPCCWSLRRHLRHVAS